MSNKYLNSITLANGSVQAVNFQAIQSADIEAVLKNSGVSAGVYGDATHTLTLTVDAQGRVTAVSANAIVAAVAIGSAISGGNNNAILFVGSGLLAQNDGTFTFDGGNNLSLGGASANFNIVTNTSKGLCIGAGPTQKIALWGATPVVQPATTGTTSGTSGGVSSTAMKIDATADGGIGGAAYTLADVVLALKQLGALVA